MDEMNLEPFIHIGFPKAGSTSVQEVLGDPASGFLPHNGVRLRHANDVKNPRIVDYLVHCHDFEFRPEHVRQAAQETLGGVRAEGMVPVVSSERLVGHWISGGYDSARLADRIHQVWPDARIFIVFREQRAMINSVYRQYVKKGGGRKFAELVKPRGHGHGRSPGFSLRFFKYDQVVSYYQDLFGRDRVLALPMEMLRTSPGLFFQRMTEFARVKTDYHYGGESPHANIGIDAFTASRKRLLNVLLEKDRINDYSIWSNSVTGRFAKLLLKASLLAGGDRRRLRAAESLRQEVDKEVRGYYGASNARLQRLTDLDLAAYGYEFE